jgi:hypothetical protein
MSLSQMQVFNDFVRDATIETLAAEIDKFNAASNGVFMLTTEEFSGDFLQEAFFAGVHSSQRRVNRYAANTDVTPVDLSQGKISSVKIAGAFGPIRFEPSQFGWNGQNEVKAIEVASRNFAEALLSDQINTSIAALVAATSNQTDAAHTATELNYIELNKAHAKFGDRSGSLIADVMTGAAYHALLGVNLGNANTLFDFKGVTVVEILGKRVVVIDSPALIAGGKQRVLSLSSGAAIVSNSRDIMGKTVDVVGKQRIETLLQYDYSFGLTLKGYSWNEAAGGKSPDDAKIATGTNWVKTYSSIKQTAGTILIAR